MAGVAGADHRAVEDIQRREQGGRAMSLVVVGQRPGSARLQRPPRLRSLQGLNLALLINTNHEGLVRRIHVQPHDIGQLLDERGIGRQREGADTMRLQAMRDPDPMDRRGTQALGGGPRPQTPLRRAWRRPVPRCLDDRLFASGGHSAVSDLVPAHRAATRRDHPPRIAAATSGRYPGSYRSCRATCVLGIPRAANKTMRRRKTHRCGVVPARTQRANVARCSSVSGNAATRFMGRKVPNRPPTYK